MILFFYLLFFFFFFFNDTATTEIYTLSLHDALPIYPLPDESALQTGIFLERIPVVCQRAVAVAHGVRVFAHDERAASVRMHLVGRPFNNSVDGRIHRTNNIRHPVTQIVNLFSRLLFHALNPDTRLEVKRTARVITANPAGHSIVVWTIAGLVPERPENDGSMVLVALDHAQRSLEKGRSIPAFAPDLLIIGMRFQVCFVDNIQTELVAQIEPVGVVGVVRGTDRVE